MRPVVPAPCEDMDARRLDVHGKAVAVPLDLECPVRTDRRRLREECKTWLHAIRHRVEGQVRLAMISDGRQWTADRGVRFRAEKLRARGLRVLGDADMTTWSA